MLDFDTIYHGDCLELFKKLPDASVDLAFADPPFNLNKKYDDCPDDRELEDYLKWCQLWITEMVRVVKPTGSIFIHNVPRWLVHFAKFLNESKVIFRNWIAWDATSGVRSTKNKTLAPNHYGVLFYGKSEATKCYQVRVPHRRCRKSNCNWLIRDYGGKIEDIHPFGVFASDCWNDIYRVNHKKFRQEGHPCQLPITLLERIILMASDVGDMVFDPFLGTGTTSVAAKKLGRKYLGFESSQEYFDICERRLANTVEETKIGKSYVSIHLGKAITLRDKDWEDLSPSFKALPDLKSLNFTIVQPEVEVDIPNKDSTII